MTGADNHEITAGSEVCTRSGQSIISVMVGLSLAATALLAFTSMMNMQQKEVSALGQKMAALDFVRNVTAVLSNPNTCNSVIAVANAVTASEFTFDATGVSDAAPNENILLKSVAGVDLGKPVSATSNKPILHLTAGIHLSVSSPSKANLLIQFDQTDLVRPLKPLSFPVRLRTTGPLNATTILGCASSNAGTIAKMLGLDPTVWPEYIACASGAVNLILSLTNIAGTNVRYYSGAIAAYPVDFNIASHAITLGYGSCAYPMTIEQLTADGKTSFSF